MLRLPTSMLDGDTSDYCGAWVQSEGNQFIAVIKKVSEPAHHDAIYVMENGNLWRGGEIVSPIIGRMVD